jgi:hypothetical protein
VGDHAADPARLIFIDATWAKTNMTRTHGRAPRGQRLFARVPHGHGVTMTFLAALRADGLTAPCVIDGPMNGAIFLAWGVQFLVPKLRPGKAGERSIAAVWHRIGSLPDQFSQAECRNYIRHAGYGST